MSTAAASVSASADPVAIGPAAGGAELARGAKTLWPAIRDWSWANLRQPDGPNVGERWEFTAEQARFARHWYAIDDRGAFMFRSGMLRRAKGWGKSPFGAALCAIEFVGPCRFDGFDGDGEPVAVSHPAAWVLVAAVAKDQTRVTMSLFPGLFSAALVEAEGIQLGKELIYAHQGRRRLEAVTSSPRALEGPRSTFTLKEETQHWLANNEGHAMAAVIARNATKARGGGSRVLAVSNAHEPGENSDAEHDWEAWQAIDQGKSRATGFLYDSLEAPPGVDLADEGQLRGALLAVRGDADWLDLDRHVEEIYDPRNSPASSRRFYLNQIVAAEDAWIAPHEWDRLAFDQEPLVASATLADGEEITLGADWSKSDDDSALVACRVSDGAIFALGVWAPGEHGGEIPRELVDGTVASAFGRYRVLAFFSDLHPLESYVDAWAERYGRELAIKASAKHAIAWDMRAKQKESTLEIERLHDEIVECALRHDGDKRVRRHFHNARRRPNTWGISVGKEHRESARKVDSVIAVMLARTARRMALIDPKRHRRRSGRAVFV